MTVAEIRRQADTQGRARALPGPAPVGHQVRSVQLRIDALPNGSLRVSSPQARGWAVVASTREQLATAIGLAFTEAQVAAYSRWRGQVYELDALTAAVSGDPLAEPTQTHRFPHVRGERVRADTHPVSGWSQMDDGTWRSPSGRTYRGDTAAVRRVVDKRRRLGIE